MSAEIEPEVTQVLHHMHPGWLDDRRGRFGAQLHRVARSISASDQKGRVVMSTQSSATDTGFTSQVDSSDALASRWGIGLAPWLWATRLRILFVIDGRITVGHGAEEFGLGPVLDTLRDRSFAWWVRFSVQVADRDGPEGFRFTQDGFDLDDFDQVWFFGDWPGPVANDPAVGDEVILQYPHLDDGELRVVAEWMERGGGVFAAGDHSLLGASMCHRIPRVRTMRKWTRAQGVPSFGDEDRHETLQHFGGGNYDSWEGDRWPQPISPVYRRDNRRPFFYGAFPHPLLCGEDGVIDRFPDHMHEGTVIETDDVQLNQPLGIPGFEGDEYPTVPWVFDPTTGTVVTAELGQLGVRPLPEVIAHGRTTNPESDSERFGLIGVYDGDPVNLGRVVVDSTWHHWFSMNLIGFREEAPTFYRGMQNYYRNVGLWLATPAQRASMLFAAVWGVLVGKQPGMFSKVMGIWEIGERVVDVIGRTAPQCIVSELVATFMTTEPRTQVALAAPLRPPIDMVNQAIVGGIAIELLDLAQHHIVERAHGRSSVLDEDAIRNQGLAGVSTGQRELIATLADAASDLTALRDEMTSHLDRTSVGDIPIDGETADPEFSD